MITVDERLTESFLTVIGQFPPMIREMIDPDTGQEDHHLRLAIFESFSYLRAADLTVDQLTAAQVPELLALAITLNLPSFDPSNLTPAQMATQKASSYAANYLMNRAVKVLQSVGNSGPITNELLTDAGDVMLAQIQRLQFNYDQRFNLADYLADVKARAGLLAAMSAKQSAALTGATPETIALAGQIGQALGTIYFIQRECQQLHHNESFLTTRIITGQYPLALLFARQAQPAWFKQFFHQAHRPTPAMFDHAYQVTVDHLNDAQQILTDLTAQVKLDLQVLPAGQTQQQLLALLADLQIDQ